MANRKGSYVAVIEAAPGHLLLGGVKRHVSSRFETRADASSFTQTSRETNEQAGRKVLRVTVKKVSRSPEIGSRGSWIKQNPGHSAIRCNPSDTVRRDWLKKQIAAGKMEAKLVYSIEHDGAGDRDVFGGKWMPARLSTSYEDFIEGQMNFRSHDFTSKSGMAYRGPNGTINLIVHSNLAYTLRPTGVQNPSPSAIPAHWTPATVSRKGGQIQIRMGGQR